MLTVRADAFYVKWSVEGVLERETVTGYALKERQEARGEESERLAKCEMKNKNSIIHKHVEEKYNGERQGV